ncbi:hypothetical protein QBC36DRAFT_245815 [Triangularia setosa]|uniref:Uncharacterized protein n=1 Tax=Triangularia setosa TaxID=2587417 RepID=A0AAN6W431_9PEZI|nr:hypothetical protein QBC36DRAFT_245815 [Podospora setosa]
MDGSAPTQDGNPAGPPPGEYLGDLAVVNIAPEGDLVLRVTFNTSKETLKAAKKAREPPAALKSTVKQGYRVQIFVLKDNSGYFSRLLGDTRFAEAKAVENALQKLSLSNIKPSEADLSELPVVEISEDDEASRTTNLNTAFGDLMRILHRVPIATKPITVRYLAVIAVLADRFNCTPLVSKWLNAIKFKFPPTILQNQNRTGPALSKSSEELLRQKILVSWLLDRPLVFQSSTRELILYGSRRWCTLFDEEDEQSDHAYHSAAWWDLPSGLEQELQLRRDRLLNAISSIPSHFLSLYTSPTASRPQCKLGYTSSPSCDSFQLGEAIKFLINRNLFCFVDFAPQSYDIFHASGPPNDYIMSDVSYIIKLLKQCPAYQIDKDHHHCGLRGRMGRILEFIEARLVTGVGVSRRDWEKDRSEATWEGKHGVEDGERKAFKYTGSVSSDARLRYGDAFAAEKLTREVFTADEWDWTAQDHEAETEGISFGRWKLGEKSFPR